MKNQPWIPRAEARGGKGYLSIPPKYSVGQKARILKSAAAKEIFLRYPEIKRELWGGEFWEDGYSVRTVEDKVTSETIR